MSETEIVTVNELAALFDCSTVKIHELARDGVVVRTERGQYLKDVSVQNYIKRLRASAAGRTNSEGSGLCLPDESARLKAAQAEYYDIKNARSRGELVLVAEVEAACFKDYRATRDKLMQIPSKIAPRMAALKDASECFAILEREFEKALNSLSDEAAERLRKKVS